jgi:CBS domain-containing protein
MSVSAILNEKGGTVFTVRKETSIAEACAELARRRIGAIVITDDDGKVDGILSERDIVRRLAEHGPAVLQMTVGECMTAEVESCRREDSIVDVMTRMTHGRFRHFPVIENDRLAGLISIGDVVKHRIEEAEREAAQIREYITMS